MRVWLGILLGLAWALTAWAQTQEASPEPLVDPQVIERLHKMRANPDNSPEANARLDALIAQAEQLNETRPPDPFNISLPPDTQYGDGREVITDFDVDIVVETSGDMIVTETINVIAQGRQIKRGIFRELPRYYTFFGVRQEYDYELLSVTRNGREDNVSRSYDGNAVTWRIGNASVFLNPGPFEYQIRYRVGDQVRRHDDKDEVYWNATGSYWMLPIDSATATITFPDGATITEADAYTGRLRSTAKDARIETDGSTVTFTTTKPLQVREGLSVAASIDKGIIDPLSAEELSALFWLRYGALILLGIGGSLLSLFYFVMWNRIGRDPVKPPVFARYGPPKGYGPAAVHYIFHRRHKGMDALSAQLLELGAQGAVEIKVDKKTTAITRTGEPRTEDGRRLMDAILPGGKASTRMTGKPNSALYKGAQSFLTQIRTRYGRDYYRRNLGWAILGILGSILLVVILFNAGVAMNSPFVAAGFLGLAALNLLFLKLLPAPTKKGSRVHSEIEGFKLYLETAEEDRINTGGPLKEQPPMMSVELYERFLPYAVALGVEKNWTKHFKKTLPKEAAEYRPSYARGSRIFDGGSAPIDVGQTIAKAMTAGVAAAAPVSQSTGSGSSSGWSSGSGGGGFSGGGGGGGGGGGW